MVDQRIELLGFLICGGYGFIDSSLVVNLHLLKFFSQFSRRRPFTVLEFADQLVVTRTKIARCAKEQDGYEQGGQAANGPIGKEDPKDRTPSKCFGRVCLHNPNDYGDFSGIIEGILPILTTERPYGVGGSLLRRGTGRLGGESDSRSERTR